MNNEITTNDARRVIMNHRELFSKLIMLEGIIQKFEQKVRESSNSFVTDKVLKILKDVPIEEINRDKTKIRVKALREAGYNSIADVAYASIYSLILIDGISKEIAYLIKYITNSFITKTKEEVKVQLSSDDKSRASAELITSLSKYRHSIQYATRCKTIIDSNAFNINKALNDLFNSSGSLRMVFTSEEQKKKAYDAYSFLFNLLEGDYGKELKEILTAIDKALKMTEEEAWKDFSTNSVEFFKILEQINPGILGSTDTLYGLPESLALQIQEQPFYPDGLLCTLRRYQEWGVKYILHQERVLLGDEMGLGKTIQAIAVMISLRNTGKTHFLVVCPASVLTNWCREIQKMSILTPIKIHGDDKEEYLEEWIKNGGVAVTTYETTRALKLEDDFKYDFLVVDEAHYVKNPEAQRTESVKHFCDHSNGILFMTGTALENKVEEMILLIDILQPQIADKVKNMTYLASAPQFREKVAPVYYRRRREDVLTELPEKLEIEEWCKLNQEEETLYEKAILNKDYADARRLSFNLKNLYNSCKAERMYEIIDQAKTEGRKILIFSFFLDTITNISKLLGDRCLQPINGSVPPQRRQEIIDEFDKAPAGSVLLAQIISGGTGLNIQ